MASVGAIVATAIPAGVSVATVVARGAVIAAAVPAGVAYASPAARGAIVIKAIPAGRTSPQVTTAGAVVAAAVPSGRSAPVIVTAGAVTAVAIPSGSDGSVGAVAAFAVPVGASWVGTAAAGRWLYVHTQPPAQIYATDTIRGRLRPWLPMHRAQFEVSATAAQIGERNDAFAVSLVGVGAALRARLAAQAPFGVRVDVMDGGQISRSGITSGIGNSADGIDIDCEASGWTTPLPLRTNADLGTFRDIEALPLRYGRAVPGRCVRLGSSGKVWLWADHASERITSVQVDGQDYGAWQWRNDVDANGNPITIITTVDELDEGAQLVAVGDGMRDSLAGTLIVNPADVVFDLCRRANRPVDRGDLVPLRAECQSRGLEISGSIDGGTLQGAMVLIANSIYAAFARELPGLMRLLPRTGATLAIPARDTPTASAQRDSIATRLRVRFGLEDGQPRGNIEVRAPGVEAVRGVASADVTLPLIRDPRAAVDVATRMLGDRARPAYKVQAATQRTRIVPGDVVDISVPKLAIAGEAIVTDTRIDDTTCTPALLLRIGPTPTITVAAVSAAYAPQQYTDTTAGGAVGTDRTIPITGPDGRPIVGARCTLDGSLTRTSDSAGIVAFPASAMTPGTHVVDIVAAGYATQRLTVTV